MTKELITKDNIQLGVTFENKEEAIRSIGNAFVKYGYVASGYVDKMLEREELTSTYMGNAVAIPHGTDDAKDLVTHTGLMIMTIPDGVDFNGNTVNLLIGIAGKGDEHLDLLSKVAIVCAEESNVQKIVHSKSKDEILNFFK